MQSLKERMLDYIDSQTQTGSETAKSSSGKRHRGSEL
jgi:hypothetical protein